MSSNDGYMLRLLFHYMFQFGAKKWWNSTYLGGLWAVTCCGLQYVSPPTWRMVSHDITRKKSFQTMSLEPLLKGNGRAPGAVKEILEITETHKVFLVKSHHNMASGQRSWQKLCTLCEGATFYLCLADLFLTMHRHGQPNQFYQTLRLYKFFSADLSWLFHLRDLLPRKLTCPWKIVVGRLVSFLSGPPFYGTC